MGDINLTATTTGIINPVVIDDLGYLELVHPSTVNLTDIFDASELADSDSLQLAISSGWITLRDQNNYIINDVSKIQIQEVTRPSIGLYAYATTDLNGNLLGSRGIASCVRVSTGTYTYLFDTPTPTPNYVVGGIAEQIPSGDSDVNIFVKSKSLSGFQIKLGRGDNSSSSDVPINTNHSVWVLGPTSTNSFEGSIVTNKQTVTPNSIVKFVDESGNIITDSVGRIDSTGISIPDGATYKINDQPIKLANLSDISSTPPVAGQVLTFNGTQWGGGNLKNSWVWGGVINVNNAKNTRSFEGLNNLLLEDSPYFTFTNCILYGVVLGGKNLNNPYAMDIMINNSLAVTYQRLGTFLFSSYYPLSIQINQGSSVWFRFRQTSGQVALPTVMCYFKEL